MSRLFHKEMCNQNFHGLRLASSAALLSHLFFADDVIIMAEATVANGKALLDIFQCYCRLSGQASNKAKSSLVVSRRAPKELKMNLQNLMGINLSEELGTYLGVPLTAGIPRLKHFDNLRSRITAKLHYAWTGIYVTRLGLRIGYTQAVVPLPPSLA